MYLTYKQYTMFNIKRFCKTAHINTPVHGYVGMYTQGKHSRHSGVMASPLVNYSGLNYRKVGWSKCGVILQVISRTISLTI